MYIHPGLTAVMKLLMKSNEPKDPASQPKKEKKTASEKQTAETVNTLEANEVAAPKPAEASEIPETVDTVEVSEIPETQETVVEEEPAVEEPHVGEPLVEPVAEETHIVEPSEQPVAEEPVDNEPETVSLDSPESEKAEIEVVSSESEADLTEAILEPIPGPGHLDEDDDPFHDDEPAADGQPIHDYSSYNKINLINTLRKIIGEGDVDVIKPHADAIKACFYKIRNHEISEQKAAFVADGNEEELFQPDSDPFEQELKDLFREYKNLRYESNKKQEAVKEENYLKKIEIIDEIKTLVNSENSLNNTFQLFNELQLRFKALGQVPQAKVKDLWENYHYQVERFYDFVKIDRELRDLDLKRNMDQKMLLCLKA